MQTKNDTQLRQWAMLGRIPQHPRQITARELTDYLATEGFEVSRRTIERDLQALSAAFPLEVNDKSVNRHPKLSTHRRPIFSTFSCC